MWKVALLIKVLFCTNSFTESLSTPSLPTTQQTKSNVLSKKKVVVVGGGPVGLYFAALMLHKDPTVRIEILEKRTESSINAFGLGISYRMQHRLSEVPGLKEQIYESTADLPSLGYPMISREDLSEQMRFFLEENEPSCQLQYGTSCESVDFGKRQITTNDGRIIDYDLLVAADGVNSKVRQQLVSFHGLQEERYLQDVSWKTLNIPKQSETDARSFKPLRHPSISGGRVLPKAPEGHILMLLWDGIENNNPKGIETADDLKVMITEAMQDKKGKVNPVRKLFGLEVGDDINKDRQVVFNDVALRDCFDSRAGRVHYLKIPQYHYEDSVALIGDSAHAFNSLLGQGCATGLESTHTLVESLLSNENLKDALSNYTERALVDAHAITELSLVSYAMRGGKLMSLKLFPLIVWNMIRGKSMMKRLKDITVPYSQIAKENKTLLKVCRRAFEKKRIDYY